MSDQPMPGHDDRSAPVGGGLPAGAPAPDVRAAPPVAPYPAPPVPPYAGTGGAAPQGQTPGPGIPPGWAAPAQAYAPPTGYAPPPQGYGPYVPTPAPPPARGGAGLGAVAFVLSLLAALGATVLGAIAAFAIGLGTGREISLSAADVDFDWSILSPVRGWVLVGEIAFWLGTVLGIWALVQGIVAIVKDRGRGWAIAAVVIAIIGPIAFATGVQAFLLAGFASGASAVG